jgi:ankyrin repeat protein
MTKPQLTQDELNAALLEAADLFEEHASVSVKYASLALGAGADANAKGHEGWTPLHCAVRSRNDKIAKILIASGADVNAKTVDGWTPLHVAAIADAKEAARILIANGADLNATDEHGGTPLLWAKGHGHASVAEVLEEAEKRQGHAGRVTEERKDKGPRQVGG